MSRKLDASEEFGAGLDTHNTIKLRGPPKASTTKRCAKAGRGQGNDLGYSNNVEDGTMGNPQPTPKSSRIGGQFND